jgi:hypothetical protein
MLPNTRKYLALGAAAMMAAALGTGCSKAKPSTGSASIVVHALAIASQIDHVTLTITGNNIPSPIVQNLTGSGTVWSGNVPSIPTGPATFSVDAFNASSAVIYHGSANANIVAGQNTAVAITLLDVTGPPPAISTPVIDSVVWMSPVTPLSTQTLTATAHDSDGQALGYLWTGSPAGCSSFSSTTVFNPQWTAPGSGTTCHLTVAVSDTDLNTVSLTFDVVVTAGTGSATVDVSVNQSPNLTLTSNITIGVPTLTGTLTLVATDPDGDTLHTPVWTTTCTGMIINLNNAFAPSLSYAGPSAACSVTVTVADTRVGAEASSQLSIGIPPNCGAPCGSGLTCSTGGTCATDPCVGVTCNQPATCQVATGATCNGSTGTPVCTYPLAPVGTACTGGTCNASGVCVPTDPCAGVVCNQPPTCFVDTGATCSNGTCSYPTPAASGAACPGGTCNGSGTCVPTDPCAGVVCNQPPVCFVDTGATCSAGTCSYPTPAPSGTACPGGTCNASGVCVAAVVPSVVPQVGRGLRLVPPGSLAMNAANDVFVAGTFNLNTPVDFQTNPGQPPISITSSGGNDILIARYDSAGQIVWARNIGVDDPVAEPGAFDQTAAGAAVTQNGALAFFGRSVGTVTFGANTIATAAATPYVAAVDSTTPDTRLWIRRFGLGTNGNFRAIAANPNHASNRIAVCGVANAVASSTPALTGVTFEGGTDLILAVFDSAGTLLWFREIGGPSSATLLSNEACSAIAVDDSGNVVATGTFDGESVTFPGAGATPNPQTLTGPSTAAQKYVWVARFDGANGNPMAAAAFAAASISNPTGIAVRPDGNIVVAGTYAAQIAIGTTLISQGGDDAFVAVLDPALGVAASTSFGTTGVDRLNSVAVTGTNEILVTGTFTGTMTGAGINISSNGTAASDAFLAKLDSTSLTASASNAKAYGDLVPQTGDVVVANRFSGTRVAFGVSFAGTVDFSSPSPAPTVTLTAQGVTDVGVVFANEQ